MHPRARQSLLDVADACWEIELTVAGLDLEQYRSARQVQLITERLFLIVGEALSRAQKHEPGIVSGIPNARNIIGMRNRIVHGYDAIDDEIVWTAASRHAVILRNQVLDILGTNDADATR